MSKRLTHSEFLEKIPSKFFLEFTVISNYVDATTPVFVKDANDIIYKQIPSWIMSGRTPSVITAIDKDVVINVFLRNNFNGKLLLANSCNDTYPTIFVKDSYNIVYKTTYSNLKYGKFPRFSSAVDVQQAFKILAANIHDNKYDYSKVSLQKIKDKVVITCPVHGDFTQSAINHIIQKQGCHKCYYEKSAVLKTCTQDVFLQKALAVHGNLYDYSKTVYTKSSDYINVICKIHGEYSTNANNHLQGAKCPKCATLLQGGTGFTKSLWKSQYKKSNTTHTCTVYFIKMYNESEVFIKIGKTFRDIKKRFNKKLPYNFDVLKLIHDTPSNIFDLENNLHKKYKNFRYIPKIMFDGFSECFTLDILNDL